jgi:hypothetical protein
MIRMEANTRIMFGIISLWSGVISGIVLNNYYTSPQINDANLITQSARYMYEYSQKKYDDITDKTEPFSYSMGRMEIALQDNPDRKKEIIDLMTMITIVQNNESIMDDSTLYALNVKALGAGLADYVKPARVESQAWTGYIAGAITIGLLGTAIFARG